MQTLGTIRKFNTARFSVVVDAVEDDCCIDDLASEPDAQKEILWRLNDGSYTLFCARVRVFLDGAEVATDYLGGCVYADIADFQDHRECGRANRELAARGESGRCGSYFSDMIRNACAEARANVARMQSVKVRA